MQFNRVLQNRALEQAGRFIAEDLASRFLLQLESGKLDKADRASSVGQRGQHSSNKSDISLWPQRISHAQLNTQLAQGTVAPLYVVVGEEDLLRDMALGALKSALLGEGESDFNCDLFYGDDVSGAEIVTCASEVAVFAARRVVVVKAADKLPARECDAILPYLKEPNDSTARDLHRTET